jgi:dTDP-glucose 4,6-dehydratase
MILSALSEKALPVYGDGKNIRDWIHVKDHARGILKALETGEIGDTYCFGGNSERTNLDVVHSICDLLDELKPLSNQNTYRTQIKFVTDRPGHDFRYAIDDGYAQRKLGYRREYTDFEMGLKQTIQWYLANMDWCQKVLAKPGAKVSYDWSMLQSKNDS